MKIFEASSTAPKAAIVEVAERLLRESPYYFLKNLTCRFEGGVLTLCGRVPYGQLKQFAESIVCRIDGVREVVNRVEVFDPARGHAMAPAARNAG